MPCITGGAFEILGHCFVLGTFGGDYIFFSLVMLIITAVIMWKLNIPAAAAIPIGIVFVFSFAAAGFAPDVFQFLMTLTVIVLGVLLAFMFARVGSGQ